MSKSTLDTHGAVSVSVTTRLYDTFVVTRISITDADGGIMEINAFSEHPLQLNLQPIHDLRTAPRPEVTA